MIKERREDFDHEELRDPQKITNYNVRMMAQMGLDIKRDEVADVIDDPDMRKRIYKVPTRKTTFFMGK